MFGKEMIPVVASPLEGVDMPAALTEISYIFFYSDPEKPESGFFHGTNELDQALKIDREWTMWQTRLQQRAAQHRSRKVDALLMRDEELADALEWLQSTPPGHEVRPDIANYISLSENAEQLRDAARAAEIEEKQRVIAEADRAVEEATKRIAEAEKKVAEAESRVAKATKMAIEASNHEVEQKAKLDARSKAASRAGLLALIFGALAISGLFGSALMAWHVESRVAFVREEANAQVALIETESAHLIKRLRETDAVVGTFEGIARTKLKIEQAEEQITQPLGNCK